MYVLAAPRFETVENQPHDVNASVGDDVNIRCLTYANPPATVHWFQNGIELNRKHYRTLGTLLDCWAVVADHLYSRTIFSHRKLFSYHLYYHSFLQCSRRLRLEIRKERLIY